MIHGVTSVEPVLHSYEQHIARQRLDRKWRDALERLAREGPDPVQPGSVPREILRA